MNWFLSLWRRYRQYKKLLHDHPHVVANNGWLSSETYTKYGPSTDFSGRKVLNVGCGKCVYLAPNVTNLDAYPGTGVNVVWDLSKTPLPFPDQSFDLIIANHVLEHIPNWFECMKELARVVKIGGQIEVWIPPVSSDSSFTYRDHINRIGASSFAGCRNMHRSGTNLTAAEEFKQLGYFKDLEIIHVAFKPVMRLWTALAPDSALNWMAEHLRNVISENGYIFVRRPPCS